MIRKFLHFLCLSLLALSCVSASMPVLAQDDDDGPSAAKSTQTVQKLEAVRYVTWWFHSAMGYHPAILLRIENASGADLSGIPIKFQARFNNLRDGYVNVAREEIRTNMEPKKQIHVFLKGPRAFELPIDQEYWPRMECKVMCRVGDTDDEATQTLMVTKLDAITMSFDEAMSQFAKQPDIRVARNKPRPVQVKPEKPLVAMAGALGSKITPPTPASMSQFMSSSFIPGLGDDFYTFEKKFGIPAEFDAAKEWTWARYQNNAPEFNVIVGSRGQTGKADLIVATVPPTFIKGEAQLTELAKAISGKFRGEQTTPANHSVRYLSTGRLEFGTLSAKNYRAVYFIPGENSTSNNSFVVVVTRLPGNVLNILRQEAPRAKLLRFLAPITGLEDT